jgi:methyl-accepting chemotaxis protein
VRPYYVGIGLALLLAVIGGFTGALALVLLGMLIAFGILAAVSLGKTRAALQDNLYDDLSPDSRILVKPLKKIYNEMSEAASGNSTAISPYIAQEALAESGRLMNQSVQALLLRDRLVKESRGRYDAEKSITDLRSRLTSAASEDEKTSLQSALDARTQEIGHYETLTAGISKIESSVKQAEAAMAEMRARLISTGSAGVAEQGSDPLREAVGRMQALSTSLTEAQEMLQR